MSIISAIRIWNERSKARWARGVLRDPRAAGHRLLPAIREYARHHEREAERLSACANCNGSLVRGIFQILLALAAFFAVCTLVALFTACSPSLPPRDVRPTPRIWAWPERSFPVRVWIAGDMEPCQVAAIHAAVAFWEGYTGRDLFEVPEVIDPNAPVYIGTPPHGIVWRKLVGAAPGVRGVARAIWLVERERLVYGVNIGMMGCSPRTASHELGHGLGLYHSPDHRSVMYWKADDTAFLVHGDDVTDIASAAD